MFDHQTWCVINVDFLLENCFVEWTDVSIFTRVMSQIAVCTSTDWSFVIGNLLLTTEKLSVSIKAYTQINQVVWGNMGKRKTGIFSWCSNYILGWIPLLSSIWEARVVFRCYFIIHWRKNLFLKLWWLTLRQSMIFDLAQRIKM